MRKLSPAQIADMIARYRAGESSERLARAFGVSPPAIRGLLERRGIARRTLSESMTRYACNHAFFSAIDSEEQAYWLGFLLADGAIVGKSVTLCLAAQDKEHLKKFLSALGSSHPVKEYQYGEKTITKVFIHSPALIAALAAFGVGERKSFTATPPSLPIAFEPAFWRGVVDGDGNLYWPSKTRKTRGVPALRLCGSWATCQQFAEWVNRSTKRRAFAYPHKSIWQVTLSGLRQTYEIAALLYETATVFLDRKMAVYRTIQAAALTPRLQRECSLVECGRNHYGKGFCKRHYYYFCERDSRHARYLLTTGK